MNQSERRLFLINHLLNEDEKYKNILLPDNSVDQFNLYRSLVNVRMPKEIDEDYLKVEDDFLNEETKKKGVIRLEDLTPVQNEIYLWKGDITTLQCDAIVNVANSQMLGCFCPCHACIDKPIPSRITQRFTAYTKASA